MFGKIFGNRLFQSEWLIPGVFFVLLFLVYPGMFCCVPTWNYTFFEAGTIVWMMTALLFFRSKRISETWLRLPREFELAFLVLLGIQCFHFFAHANSYTWQEKGMLFMTTAVPFTACIFAKGFSRLLVPCLAFCWIHNVIFSLVQYYGFHWMLFGLPLNINWNAAYLAVTAPFTVLWCLRLHLDRRVRIALSVIVSLVTLWLVALTESRGCALAVVCILIFLAFRYTPAKKRLYVLEGLLGLLLLGVVSYMLFAPEGTLMNILERDERIYFIKSTVHMIAGRPVFGYGGPSFETEYLNYRTPEFFTLIHSAVRVDHPHNHFLYTAACVGIAGLICWLYMLLVPMWYAVRRFPRFSSELKLSLLCLIGLLVHGQFDLVMFRWPTSLLAMVFLGLLLHECEAVHAPFWRPHFLIRFIRVRLRQEISNENAPSTRVITVLLTLLAAVTFLATIFAAGSNLAAELLSRRAAIAESGDDMALAADLHRMAAGMPGSNLALKSRAFAFASKHDPASVDFYLDLFRSSSTPEYGYVNDYAAFAYVMNGDYAKAVPFLKRSIELRPYSVIPLLMLSDVYSFMDNRGASDAVKQRLMAIMEFRKLDNDDLTTIMKNQDLDISVNFKRFEQ